MHCYGCSHVNLFVNYRTFIFKIFLRIPSSTKISHKQNVHYEQINICKL